VYKKNIITWLIGMAVFVQAEFVVQGSYSLRMYDNLVKMSGYNVQYDHGYSASPYDISLGYLFNFKDVAVVPVMVEGKVTTVESYLNAKELKSDKIAPLELLIKPGLRLTGSDVYMILGYQMGEFKQSVKVQGHELELRVKPNFYGVGYTKMLSDYLDYLAEVKIYYQSDLSYGVDFEKFEMDPNIKISDARMRLGFRIKV